MVVVVVVGGGSSTRGRKQEEKRNLSSKQEGATAIVKHLPIVDTQLLHLSTLSASSFTKWVRNKLLFLPIARPEEIQDTVFSLKPNKAQVFFQALELVIEVQNRLLGPIKPPNSSTPLNTWLKSDA